MQAVARTVKQADNDIFTAIAHPFRRQILDSLRGGEQSVHRLAANFAVSRPAISQHLRVLVDVGLLREQRVGRENFYALHADGLQEVNAWVSQFEVFWLSKLDALDEYLAQSEAESKNESKKGEQNKRAADEQE
jgi:DNA-binding transcriptional ArsR family regulator